MTNFTHCAIEHFSRPKLPAQGFTETPAKTAQKSRPVQRIPPSPRPKKQTLWRSARLSRPLQPFPLGISWQAPPLCRNFAVWQSVERGDGQAEHVRILLQSSAPRHCKALRSDLLAFDEKQHEGEGICRYLTTACLVLSQLVLPYNRRPIALCFPRIHKYKLPMLHPASACKPHAARPSLHLIPELVFSLPSASMRYIRGICIRWTSNKPQAAHRT